MKAGQNPHTLSRMEIIADQAAATSRNFNSVKMAIISDFRGRRKLTREIHRNILTMTFRFSQTNTGTNSC